MTMLTLFGTSAYAQNRAYRASDRQVQTLLDRIENRTNLFKNEIDPSLDRSIIDGTRQEDSINAMIADFWSATDALKNNFSSRRSSATDVQEVLNRAVGINRFVQNNRMSATSRNLWTQIRTDLNTLANYYRITWNWRDNSYPATSYSDFDSRLTGTYRLNVGQSDNVPNIVDQAIINARYQANEGARVRRNLERRLASPEILMFEKHGQTVKMSSSNAQIVTLTADGIKRAETSPNGRSVTTSVKATNRELAINYEGDRIHDFYVVFTPMSNGQLRVTRRIYLESKDQTVTVASVYDKTSQTAEWNTNYRPPYRSGNTSGEFIVPNNTQITATLDTPLSTRTVRDGDRFSMTITSPSQINGATIEGTVDGQRSGVVSGRATMLLNFQTIRMRDGRTYGFAGIVDQVHDVNGSVVNVNNEGVIRDRSQTTQTVTRAGIGAVIGAIIGAIAGGGSGAAIGAGVGAGAGAGTVILQGRDNLELAAGSQFLITATAPSNVGAN